MKRLSQPTGEISQLVPSTGDCANKVVRKAVLVHSGPNGSLMTLQSGDGEISFDDARINNIIKCHNEKILTLAHTYGGIEKMPIGAFPPLLDMHEGEDSMDRVIGRLASLLSYEVRDVPGVGEKCSCVVADTTWIGEKTVEKVMDGRIYHLSIGIDEETDTLGELSAVITPAAPGAMLLKRGPNKTSSGDKQMDVKKLEAHKNKMAKLAALKSSITTMTTKAVATQSTVKLAKKKSDISHRLSGLMKGGKITPAEFKKMDITKLAALPDEHINTMMETFEAMEPKILAGQNGTQAAVDFSSIGKAMGDKKMKSLKAEIKKDIKRLGGKLKAGEEDSEQEDDKEAEDSFEKKMSEAPGEEKKDLAEEPKKEKLDMGADIKLDSGKDNTDEMQQQIDELNTNIARLAGIVDELMNAEQEEGMALEGAMDEGTKEMAADPALEEKKALGEAASGEDKKDLGEAAPGEEKKEMAADPAADEKKLADDKKAEDDKKLSEAADDKKKLSEETKKALSKKPKAKKG